VLDWPSRPTVESLSGLAAAWSWRRSECQRNKAGAVLGGDWTSGLVAVRRDLKPIWSEYPVGDEDAGWDRVAVACSASAIDIAGVDHDKPSGSALAQSVRQTGVDRGSRDGRRGPAAHFIGDAAIDAASGHREVLQQ
jgi:hypothetical protein